MTDVSIVNSASANSFSKMTFNFSSPFLSSNAILRQELFLDEQDDEDDDLDAYYMDMPPIDMTERLKEINRALVEDPTPVNMNRVTKLRFKEIIAEYQSPRESESDDGYGDSSEIMYDAEEETDSLCGGTKALTEELIDTTAVLEADEPPQDVCIPLVQEELPKTVQESPPTSVPITEEELELIEEDLAVEEISKEDIANEESKYEDDFEEESTPTKVPSPEPFKVTVSPRQKETLKGTELSKNSTPSSESNIPTKPKTRIDSAKKSSKSKKHSESASKSFTEDTKLKLEPPTSLNLKNRPKTRSKGLSSSQPIPTIKPALLSPYQLTPKSNSFVSTSTTKLKFRRTTSSGKPSVVNSTDKSKNFVPTRSPIKPLKAVHHESLYAALIAKENAPEPSPVFEKKPKSRVRKAASTTDLHRHECDPQREMNDTVYKAWLQQKKQEASASKKEEKHIRSAQQATAAAKFAERKRLAEEAFQQWLRKKKEQLHLEKKLRVQQRKLEHQASYAKTQIKCDEAYKEWCYRKKDEIQTRRSTGGAAARSRSLERTWAQEKTRKLYSAYLSRN